MGEAVDGKRGLAPLLLVGSDGGDLPLRDSTRRGWVRRGTTRPAAQRAGTDRRAAQLATWCPPSASSPRREKTPRRLASPLAEERNSTRSRSSPFERNLTTSSGI